MVHVEVISELVVVKHFIHLLGAWIDGISAATQYTFEGGESPF